MQIWFDMDGTLADLYGVEDWLPKLEGSDPSPYEEAKPIWRMANLARVLNKLTREGHEVGVISWTSKGSSAEYAEAVAQAKNKWLRKHLPSVQFSRIDIVAYGTPKRAGRDGILFDDEEKNRIEWGKGAYEPQKMWEILAAV